MTTDIEKFIRQIEQQARGTEQSVPIAFAISGAPVGEVIFSMSVDSLSGQISVGGGDLMYVSSARLADPIIEMREAIKKLEARVAALEEDIRVLKEAPQEEVIVLRTISREQAKEEIRELYSSGETLYYSDVAQRLRLDLRLVVELCQELEEEGALEIDANYVER